MKHFSTAGFSLLELIYLLAISIILITVAIPGFNHFIQQEKTIATVNQWVGILNFSRLSALTYHQPVSLCASTDHRTCNADWQGDFIVFLDENRSGEVESKDKLLRVWQLPSQKGSIRWQNSRRYLTLQATGISTGNAGKFYYCPANRNLDYARAIVLNTLGRAKIVDKSQEPKLKC